MTYLTNLIQTTRGKLGRFRDEAGAVATEYIVVLVVIALAVIVGAGLVGSAINDHFTNDADSIGSIGSISTSDGS